MVPRCAVRVAVLAAAFVATGAVNSWARTDHQTRHESTVRRSSASHRRCANVRLMPTAKDLKLIRAATLCLINRERTLRGEHPLRPNARLRRAAQAHSSSMAFDDYFEHVGPRGQTPLARMRAVGYVSRRGLRFEVGENRARSSPPGWPRRDTAPTSSTPTTGKRGSASRRTRSARAPTASRGRSTRRTSV